jgi:hypothetical protein
MDGKAGNLHLLKDSECEFHHRHIEGVALNMSISYFRASKRQVQPLNLVRLAIVGAERNVYLLANPKMGKPVVDFKGHWHSALKAAKIGK